ncbi:phosphoribosylglycinamide formyltransferase [Serratia sp. DD3]|uniref:phosphoribosylglycinamide formyltransferase n=1 Tax=Serratia sp. DD3 TaxID=1410619 RepID=UPI0003C4F7C8|nr:phosphoribosylglycinamide formyltransferase [Serratia sp. DD3]KEY60307.1 phosphoribosylglycinamide formyltransferase [Serratia sp. DD3]
MKKIVVLISGQGSNLQALIDACQQGRITANIVAVISNVPQAYGLQRAKEAGIATDVLEAKNFVDREAFDSALQQTIDQYQPDLIVLAGYMRILSNPLVQHYAGRMLNIHPSLLPKYPGLHTHRQAIDNGDSEHGTSVHFVTEQLDGGPVILQAKVPIFPGDEEDEVIERVQAQEHTLYPLVVNWFIEGRLEMRDNAAWLDGQRLSEQGYAAD